MSEWSPDHIAVLGAGAMGCLFGGLLREGGLDVTLVDPWVEHVAAINRDGLVLRGEHSERLIRVPAVTHAREVGPVDLVLVQCKALHTATALRDATALFSEHTVAVSFQNGLGNEELIGEHVGVARVLGGLTAQGATVLGPGVIRNWGDLPTYVGEMGGGVSARVQTLCSRFAAAGLDTRPSKDIRRDMWKKLLGNVGLSPTSAISNLSSADLMGVATMRETVFAAVDEAARVGRAEGIDLDVDEARAVLMQLVDTGGGGTGQSRSSACMDIEHGRPTEVDWINGSVVALGEKHGIPTPVNRTLVAAVKAIERRIELAGTR